MGMSLITGIDIGRHSIKAVVVKPEKQQCTIVGFHELPVSEAVFSDNYTLNYQDSVNKLKDLKKKLPWFSHRAAIAIPDSAVISKILQIDATVETLEQEFAIHQAFSYQSPFPIEELCLDYVPVNSVLANNTQIVYAKDAHEQHHGVSSHSMHAFQVYATKRDVVETRQKAAQKAGFKPQVMDIHGHALLNIFLLAINQYQRPKWLLVDIGYSQTTLCMVGESLLYKNIALGTQSIERGEREERTSYKFIELLGQKLQRQIQMLSITPERDIDGIWLTGGGANLPLIDEQLCHALNLPCETLSPFALCAAKRKLSARISDGNHQFAVALGVALGACLQEGENHAF
ncbi:type IV pilus assembly protein PilM [Vibrio sp. FNV 38]|nr:type IV pilus assembly protein PilM [Vibrio sp. FNV 38]